MDNVPCPPVDIREVIREVLPGWGDLDIRDLTKIDRLHGSTACEAAKKLP